MGMRRLELRGEARNDRLERTHTAPSCTSTAGRDEREGLMLGAPFSPTQSYYRARSLGSYSLLRQPGECVTFQQESSRETGPVD